jgi:hypothetical protein
VPGAVFVGNAFGKLAGSTQVNELGEIETPILLTSTLSVPRVADAVIDYLLALPGNGDVESINPLVGETNVWFVLEGEKLYLLPVHGSETQWYKNVLQNPATQIDARGVGAEFRALLIADAKAVSSAVEKFRDKYGSKDM